MNVARKIIWDLPTPALLVDADALDANLADMAAACPGPRLRPHVKAHKTHRARPAAGRPRAHRASPARPSARSRAWPPPGWARTCCWPTRCSTRGASARLRRARHRRGRLRRDDRRRRRRRGARGAHRRQRRPAALRAARRPRPDGSPTRPARPGSPCAASWATRATSWRCPTPPSAPRADRGSAWRCSLAAHADVGGEVISGGGTGTYDDQHLGRPRCRPARTR